MSDTAAATPAAEQQVEITTVAAPRPTQAQQQTVLTIDMLKALPASEQQDANIKSLLEVEMQQRAFELDHKAARAAALSGEFTGLKHKTPEQAIATMLTKMIVGRSWGFNQGDAMAHVYFVNGRPSVENDLVATKLQQLGWQWEPQFDYEEVSDKSGKWQRCTRCTLWLSKYNPQTRKYEPVLDRKGQPVSVSFGAAEADHAMIYQGGQKVALSSKDTYQSFAQDMFYWRCIARVRKYYCPAALRGGAVMREEAQDVVDIVADETPTAVPPDMPPIVTQPATLQERIIALDREHARAAEPPTADAPGTQASGTQASGTQASFLDPSPLPAETTTKKRS